MFTNVSDVKDMTGYDVSAQDIRLAQAVIEAYVGRNESEINSADDTLLMAKAVGFQAVYMLENYERVYQQAALMNFGQLDAQMTLDVDMSSPFIAPLAIMSLRNLTWRRSRSVKTGAIYGRATRGRWETE